MLFDEHGFPQNAEPDFRDELLKAIDDEEAQNAAVILELRIQEEVEHRVNERIRGIFHRFLCEIDGPLALDCAKQAFGFVMGSSLSGEAIGKKHGVSREAVRKRKEKIRKDLGLPKSFFDRSMGASDVAKKRNHRNYKKKS